MTDNPKSLSSAPVSPEAYAVGGGSKETAHPPSVLPPVHLATTFVRDADNQYTSTFSYGRDDNATVRELEQALARLEGAHGPAYFFSSGMSAAVCLLLALGPGAKVVAPRVMYWGLRQWMKNDGPRHGIETTFVDFDDAAALDATLAEGTDLVWLETPGNPMWNIIDIADVAARAKASGAKVACDATVATPVLMRPLTLGADVVMHSATKYLNGHSDVVAGALAFAEPTPLADETRRIRAGMGPILAPLEAMLLRRGLRTLHVRVERQSANALAVAQYFKRHPAITEVLYPGLPSHPGHAIATRQMTGGFSGMLSLRVAGGEAKAIAVAARTRLWTRATSLGGVESLIEHRASIEGADSPVPRDLLRLSTGLEPVDELIADLEQALTDASTEDKS
ncbi:MAG: PLP-dependent transferase [Pseudomonadota bacterium]